VDVDVPLFLPLSGQRRLYDLRVTARREKENGVKVAGQVNFESGWEFGYHIANAVTARAVWNPLLAESDEWTAFRKALRPLFSMFGAQADAVTDAVVSLSQSQADVFVLGKVHGQQSRDLTKLSGHAYMSGSDTWVDVPRLLGISFTQPDKVHLTESTDPQWGDALAVLQELSRVMKGHFEAFSDILQQSKDLNEASQGLNLVSQPFIPFLYTLHLT
jgi:hypothetical protein